MRSAVPQSQGMAADALRRMPDHGLEQLADEAVRRPVGETHLPAAPAHPDHFGGGPLLVGREHRTEAGQHRVEALVGERQPVDVTVDDAHARGFGLDAAGGRDGARSEAWSVAVTSHQRRAAASEALKFPVATSRTRWSWHKFTVSQSSSLTNCSALPATA